MSFVLKLLGESPAFGQSKLYDIMPKCRILPMAAWLLGNALPVVAQHGGISNQDTVVCTYADRMPHLPGHGGRGGISAIKKAIEQRIVYPPQGLQEHIECRVFVRFIVAPDGQAERIRIIRSPLPEFGLVTMLAIEQLPRLKPGLKNGRAVPVSLMIPVDFRLPDSH